MLIGGCLWAYVIGSICALAAKRDDKHHFQNKMDILNKAMSEMNLNMDFKLRMRRYFSASRSRFRQDKTTHLIDNMSPALSYEWAMNGTQAGQCLGKIDFLTEVLSRSDCNQFLVQLVYSLGYQVYPPHETIYTSSTMFINLKGLAAHNGILFAKSSVWGDDLTLTSEYLMESRQVFCLTYVFVNFLHKAKLTKALQAHQEAAAVIRKHTIRLAFRRAIRLTILMAKAKRHQEHAKLLSNAAPTIRTRLQRGDGRSQSQELWQIKKPNEFGDVLGMTGKAPAAGAPAQSGSGDIDELSKLAHIRIPTTIAGYTNASVRWQAGAFSAHEPATPRFMGGQI
jgi:hypothetical protein